MDAFLASIGYNDWILPALLGIPLLGALLLLVQSALSRSGRPRRTVAVTVPAGAPLVAVPVVDAAGITRAVEVVPVPLQHATVGSSSHATPVIVDDEDPHAGGARQIAFWTLLIEFIVSIGLWWTFDPSIADWQAVVDEPWI